MGTLALVILAVHDLARARQFYRDAFGWTQVVEAPTYAEFATDGGPRLGLYERAGYLRNFDASAVAIRPAGGVMATELYFYCRDVNATLARLVAAGGVVISPMLMRTWGEECAYVTDHDGNVVVVARGAAGNTA